MQRNDQPTQQPTPGTEPWPTAPLPPAAEPPRIRLRALLAAMDSERGEAGERHHRL